MEMVIRLGMTHTILHDLGAEAEHPGGDVGPLPRSNKESLTERPVSPRTTWSGLGCANVTLASDQFGAPPRTPKVGRFHYGAKYKEPEKIIG